MRRHHFDIGLVVPLREEFSYVIETAPTLGTIAHGGTYFYRLDFGAISTLACIAGQMGPIPALQAATRLLEFSDVRLLVLLGIAGALDGDVSVGDVVVASEVNEFQANSKAISNGDEYQIRYSGRHWPLAYPIREAIEHFEFAGGDNFRRWRAGAEHDYASLTVPNKAQFCPPRPRVHVGPLASGSIVAASQAFIEELKRINRRFVAIDMEAAGVAPAAAERIHPVAWMAVRGISDRANEEKSALDVQGKGAWRRYCVHNATSFLKNLLAWQGFLDAASVSSARGEPASGRAAELAHRLQSRIGGAWLVGVAFGIYSHGPFWDDGAAIPMDLSRLRVRDPAVSDLLDALEKAKCRVVAGDDLDAIVAEFERLLDAFQGERPPAISALLRDFDRVVIEMVAPSEQDGQDRALLLEADKLEQERGPEAAVEFLAGVAHHRPQLRGRYVDALHRAHQWQQIIDTTNDVELSDLSRGELEHLIVACTKTADLTRAAQLLRRHQLCFVDKAATRFRRNVGVGIGFDDKASESGA